VSKLAHEKESMSTEYQANITFLNQQITKLIASNELKNNEIRELHEYIALLKKEQFESLKELEMKWKNERKERENEREKERALREKVEGELMEKEKEWKNRERELERDIEKERREKNKWVINNDKLEKEIERLVHENTELEESCKVELTKNQKTIIHTGGAKRELANELERQKTDL
jgi:transducin (beta)-like 1